jgi:iron-sulfur cluster repair protein YtfE (RIC family)
MHVTIGRSKKVPGDLVDLLGECHQRIRKFTMLATAAARRTDVPADETVEACSAVERYFTEALPLHVADEEESLLPRLRGHSPEVDQALETMHGQHQAHEPRIDALLQALSALREHPESASARRALEAIASELLADFEAHLTLEETVLFPVIRQALSPTTQSAIVEELRARRRSPASAP